MKYALLIPLINWFSPFYIFGRCCCGGGGKVTLYLSLPPASYPRTQGQINQGDAVSKLTLFFFFLLKRLGQSRWLIGKKKKKEGTSIPWWTKELRLRPEFTLVRWRPLVAVYCLTMPPWLRMRRLLDLKTDVSSWSNCPPEWTDVTVGHLQATCFIGRWVALL